MQRHIQEGRIFDRLRLASPFKELANGLLVAGFDKDAFSAEHRVKFYEFEMATGALTLQTVGAMPPENSVARIAMAPSSVNELETLPAFYELAGKESAVMIDAPSPDITGAIAAIDALTARIESEFDASMFTEEMIPRIAPGDGFMMDEDFFNQLVIHRCAEAAPALRRLLMAYLSRIEGGEGCMPWYNGYALRALVLLDLDADDVYRLHLIKGDLEHDQWPYNSLYPEYLRERGWRHEADLRFSTFLTLAGLQNTDVSEYELLAKAAEMVEPQQFCNIVLEEFKDSEHVIDYFIESLPQANKFEKAVAKHLRALRGI